MDLKAIYNRIAEDWNEDHKNDTWWGTGTDKFLSYLKKGDSILDVGCAGGIKSEYLTKKGFVVTGIDLSDKMIELARKRLSPPARFFVADINEPLDLDTSFDGVFAQAVLLHIPKKNTKRVIASLAGFLKPTGYFYIAVKKLKEGTPDEQMVKENDYGYEYERFFSYYTLDEITRHLDDLGLKLIHTDETSIGTTRWIQVIAQK